MINRYKNKGILLHLVDISNIMLAISNHLKVTIDTVINIIVIIEDLEVKWNNKVIEAVMIVYRLY